MVEGNWSRNSGRSTKAGTEGSSWKTSAYCLAVSGLLSCLYYTIMAHLFRVALSTMASALIHQLAIKKIPGLHGHKTV